MQRYTDKQGQYLAFIYYYTKIHDRSHSWSGNARLLRCYAANRASNGAVSRK